MGKFSNIFNSIETFLKNTEKKIYNGYKWIGTDGIINMETSALLVMIFMLFFPVLWASLLTFIIVISKCVLDKSKGHKNELHDMICAVVGILLGIILGTTQIAVSLL